MTITERNNKLKQLVTCLKCKLTVGGICSSCQSQYQVGTMNEIVENLEEISKILEPKPYEKFESAKDHIYKLAGDYKCWDNRLTEDEAVELHHILEQSCSLDDVREDFMNDVYSILAFLPTNNEANQIIDSFDSLTSELQQEFCKNCISRADVGQTVEDNILYYTHSDRPIDQDPDTECHMAIRTALRMLRKDLRKLPPVQTKTGHWIRKEDEFCWWYECDQCGEKPLHNRLNDKDALSDWCPHCGAYMINVPDKNEDKK